MRRKVDEGFGGLESDVEDFETVSGRFRRHGSRRRHSQEKLTNKSDLRIPWYKGIPESPLS